MNFEVNIFNRIDQRAGGCRLYRVMDRVDRFTGRDGVQLNKRLTRIEDIIYAQD